MIEKVKVDLKANGLIDVTSRLKYPKNLGLDTAILNLAPRRGDYNIHYNLVKDENAKFINLFGLSVDIVTGNIALGYFPESDSYIRIDNFYSIVNEVLFGKRRSSLLSPDDYKYILECLKLNPEFYSSALIDDIRDMCERCCINNLEYDSVILNLVSSKINKSSKEKRNLLRVLESKSFVQDIIKKCMILSADMESLAKEYFGNFISERNISEVQENMSKGIGELMESRSANLESLMMKYLSYGIPMEFLQALKSYGFGIKQRRACCPAKRWDSYSLNKVDSDFLLTIGENLSSLVYIENGNSDLVGKAKIFNALDMLRALGWEQSLLFSVDVLHKYSNASMLKSLMDKFNLEDILLESKVSMGDFCKGVLIYGDRYISLVDKGGMYTRGVFLSQYQFSSFGVHYISSSGKIFEKASGMIFKKF